MSPIERGRTYRFRLGDVICPDQDQALAQVTPDLEITGNVVFLSDLGEQARRFAVLEVKGLFSPLVVPIERLRPLAEEDEAQKKFEFAREEEDKRESPV
ncbi:MAG: hypothetical protein AMXMBFR13_03890 [Phycisphaerae bacterium]